MTNKCAGNDYLQTRSKSLMCANALQDLRAHTTKYEAHSIISRRITNIRGAQHKIMRFFGGKNTRINFWLYAVYINILGYICAENKYIYIYKSGQK